MSYVASGFGGEETDQTLSNAGPSKPVWHLVPLPLSQLQDSPPSTYRGSTQSLHSFCLASISRNLHLFTLDSFAGVPPLLVRRLLARIVADREYDLDPIAREASDNPDEATIWALAALLDPETAESFTVSLPVISVLDHLAPNRLLKHSEHPLVELPKLFRSLQPSTTFLTSLALDGMDGTVNDNTVLALKWCTHLTALWMKGCQVTDAGIRLLSSSLELSNSHNTGASGDSGGKGLCRLRAWFLPGCRGISDRSMKSFARWPGLTILDVRDTSCTSSAIDVFNRFSQILFAGYNADFQPCTDGLALLFSASATAADVLNNLLVTLVKPSTESNTAALHVVPSSRPVPSFYLPDPPSSTSTKDNSENPPSSWSSTMAFRSGGIGQIYGSGVSRIVDTVQEQRSDLQTAMTMSYEKEWLDNATPAQKRKRTMAKNKERKALYSRGRDGESTRKPVAGKVYFDKPKPAGGGGANGRSKKFVTGSKLKSKSEPAEMVENKDERRKLMMVRMVSEQWEDLQWSLPTAIADANSAPIRSNRAAPFDFDFVGTQSSQKASSGPRPSDLLDEILSTARERPVPTSQSSRPSRATPKSSPFHHCHHASAEIKVEPKPMLSPSSSPISQPAPRPSSYNPFKTHAQPSSSLAAPRPTPSPSVSVSQDTNPFKSSSAPRTPMGIRPLGSSSSSRSARSDAYDSSDIKPFLSAASGKARHDDLSDFASFSNDGSGRKRTFGGTGATGESGNVKRRGMKMFSMGGR